MNKLYVGFDTKIKLPRSGFLFIHDDLPDHPLLKVFDPTKHSLAPLKNLDETRAHELAQVLYTVYPQGENTLTVRNGRIDLAPALFTTTSFDKIKGSDEVERIIGDMLFLPTVRNVLCGKEPFRFHLKRPIAARLNRSEIGDHAALIIGLTLLNMYKGQVVVPDFGFYGRDAHMRLIRENRLIAGLYYLDELKRRAPELRQGILLIKNRVAHGALYHDAETLAYFEGHRPDPLKQDNPFNDYIKEAMG
jgi:hypothetical protein